MDRHARLAELWAWLPGFRAVAETENAHAAARRLGVSPSSLSRTIGLLEAALGRPLFERGGRGMRLTSLGVELLAQVREAMRTIDDVVALGDHSLVIASPGDVIPWLVVPALARWRRALGSSRVHVHTDPEIDPVGRLLRGELDVVLSCVAAEHRDMATEPIAEIAVAIYGAPTHELVAGGAATTQDAVALAPCVTYTAPAGPLRGWRATRAGTISLEVPDARDAAAAASTGLWLVALPERLTPELAVRLTRVGPLPERPTLYAMTRRSRGPTHPADALMRELRATAEVARRADA